MFRAQSSIIDAMTNAISRNTKFKPNEACEAVLTGIYSRHKDSFISVAVKQGVANGIPPTVMDEISIEAMLNKAGVNWTNGRVLFCHLKQYFGRSLVVSEKKRCVFFGNNDFPPEVDREILPDKMVVSYWWKQPDLLLKHQLNQMVNLADLDGLQHVDISLGGDHRVGRFRVLLKVLFRFSNGKPSITKRFEIANESHSSDDIDILNKTVLKKNH
jgi:hypothetical protein